MKIISSKFSQQAIKMRLPCHHCTLKLARTTQTWQEVKISSPHIYLAEVLQYLLKIMMG
jgi:hypothetical protein